LRCTSTTPKNIICGFSRMDGFTIGIVGNQPAQLAACSISTPPRRLRGSCARADAFNIPLLTFCDVARISPGTATGVGRHHPPRRRKLLYAFRRGDGAEGSRSSGQGLRGRLRRGCPRKHLGADFNFAWPTAEVAVMGPEGAVNIIYRRDLRAEPDSGRAPSEADGRLQGALANPYTAAERGYIDDVIVPHETRPR